MNLQAGFKLGERYEVVRAITSGGMGSIYEARDLQSGGRRVAVKQMLEHLMEGEQAAMFRQKFQSEINFLRKLQHPGIPQAYDSFILEGTYYMVMEFIVGRNLEQELEERMQLTGQPFSVDQIIRDTRQVLDILVYIHSQNPPLLHRDIKPANLIREHPSGRIKLVDFGMARLLEDPERTQTQLGTLGYSPLEQLQGKAERRSDIYALGATLHHLVTGVVPTVLNIPPVMQLKPDLDPALAAIIDRACAMELSIRFTDAREMLQALDELRPHLPLAVDPPIKFLPLPRLDEPEPRKVEAPMEPEMPFGEAEDTDHLPPPPERKPKAVDPGADTLKMETLPRPPAPRLSFTGQLAIVGILSALAFVFGLGVGRQPDKVATPSVTPSAVLPVTPSPVAVVVATPTTTPTPVVVPTPKPVVKPKPKPKPKPPPPPPEEAPVEYSLSGGPSYPTASNSGTGQETLTLMDTNARVDLNLDSDWNPMERIQSKGYFYRGFRKEGSNWQLNLDIKGYTMESSGDKYRKSFSADHQGWNSIELSGVDLAFLKGQGRSQNMEALAVKDGHYYFVSLRGSGSGMSPALFEEEMKQVWESVNLVD